MMNDQSDIKRPVGLSSPTPGPVFCIGWSKNGNSFLRLWIDWIEINMRAYGNIFIVSNISD